MAILLIKENKRPIPAAKAQWHSQVTFHLIRDNTSVADLSETELAEVI